MQRSLRICALVVLAAALTAACGGDDDDSGDATDTTTADVTTTTAATTGNGSAATLTLIASEFKFDKASLTAKAGQPLTITLQNNDSAKHNITVEELNIDKDADVSATVTSDTVTPAAGTYEYFCEYHPTAMKGNLIVS